MTELRALTFVEMDVPNCSLTYGQGACRAKFGYEADPTGFVMARFDGATNLESGAGLTGAADGKAFAVSFWFRRDSIAAQEIILSGVTTVGGGTSRIAISAETNGELHFLGRNAANTDILLIQTSALAADTWYHIMASVDLADTAKRHIYVTDVSDLNVVTYTNDTIDLTLADWGVGARPAGTGPLTGDIADLWYDDSYIDLSVEANRRKFIGATGLPVDLGADGSTPTGSAPLIYLGRAVSTFHTNLGTGGGFTVAGTGITGIVGGSRKCFNSLGTCQDRANFIDSPVTLRFAKDTAYLAEAGIEAIPSIDSANYSPAIISLGEDLGQRASVSIAFKDHRFDDTGTGYDKYPETRDYDPFTQGTYWGKFRFRNPYLRGRPLRLIQGLVGQAIGDMDTRHFLIESFEGPTLDGSFTVTAKDALKLADGDRAQAPVLSKGSLNANIASGATSATLSPAGIGNTDYPASGYLNIGGKEIVSFTRSADTLTLTRGQEGTTAVAHEAGDRLQLCLHYSADDPADIIYDLLVTYAGVAAAYITLADWQAETAAYYRRVNTAMIAEPTSVRQLLTELIQQVGLVLWWDDLNQKLRLQVLRSIATDAETFDDSNIVAESLSVTEQPDKRISQVWTFFGLKTPISPLDEPSSYRSSSLTADLDAEENDGAKLKKIFSRWIPFGGSSAAERVNQIQLGRFVTAPRKVTFDLFRRGAETPTLGEGVRIESLTMQDDTGAYENVPAQIVRLKPDDTVWSVTVEEMLFVDFSDEELTTKTLTIDSNSYNINLRTLYDANYAAPSVGDAIACYINAGVTVGSTSTATLAFDVGSWDSVAATGDRTNGSAVISSLSINTTTEGLAAGMFVRGTGITNGTKILTVDSTTQVTLDANATSTGTGGSLTFYTQIISVYLRGRIQGKGGAGGAGTGATGGDGGDAFYTRYPINLLLDTGDAEVWGGGGGDGGSQFNGDGGGGGAGTDAGAGGSLVGFGVAGNAGTATAGGTSRYGGDGGGPATSGSAADTGEPGGAAGGAIDGVSYCKKTGAGDIQGSETN